MGKLPATLFYWGDFVRDPDIRRCSHCEVGVWIRILCLMYEAELKGMLATNGVPWSDDEIACAIGGDKSETIKCVTALVTKGVASRTESGALINRRMYREHIERLATKQRVADWRDRQARTEDVTPLVTLVKRKCTTRAHAETETEAKETTLHKDKQEPEIPIWIPKESWDAFVDNRRALRSPMTPRAMTMMVKQLEFYRATGQDPGAILDQSVANGWKGVFELRRGSNGKTGSNHQSAAVGRVNRGLDNLRKVAEASGDYAAGSDASGDGGVLPTSGNPARDDDPVPRGVQANGGEARPGEPAGRVVDHPTTSGSDLFSPPFPGARGAGRNG